MKNRHSAFDTAAYYLSFRDYTKKDLRSKLVDKGYEDEEIDAAINKLAEYGYVDDLRYARSYMHDHSASKGRRRITVELANKGVPKELLSSLYEEEEVDEVATIRSIIGRRYKDMDFKDERSLRRMYGYFERRGFRYDDIKKALHQYLEA